MRSAPYSVCNSRNVSGSASSAGSSPSNVKNSRTASRPPNTIAGLKNIAVLKTGPYRSTRRRTKPFESARYSSVSRTPSAPTRPGGSVTPRSPLASVPDRLPEIERVRARPRRVAPSTSDRRASRSAPPRRRFARRAADARAPRRRARVARRRRARRSRATPSRGVDVSSDRVVASRVDAMDDDAVAHYNRYFKGLGRWMTVARAIPRSRPRVARV